MENFNFERKTDLPILWIKVPFGGQTRQHGYITRQYVDNVAKLVKAIKDRFIGRFELIVTPSDFEIRWRKVNRLSSISIPMQIWESYLNNLMN